MLADGTDTSERCQPSYGAHWATCWRGKLATHYFGKPLRTRFGSLTPPGTHSPLVASRCFGNCYASLGAELFEHANQGHPLLPTRSLLCNLVDRERSRLVLAPSTSTEASHH